MTHVQHGAEIVDGGHISRPIRAVNLQEIFAHYVFPN